VQFSFAGRRLPITLRVCRSLVWAQAAFVILGGAFVIMATTVLGSSSQIPFHGDTLTGTSALMLGLVYVAAGLALAYLGIEVGRLASWARNALVCAQVFLAVLLFFRAIDLSVSTVLNVLFCAAIVGLLFAPDTRRALAQAAYSRSAGTADPA
jgi:hypothetical protein